MIEEETLNNKSARNDALLTQKIKKCPECGCKYLITDAKRAEIFCYECGLVIEENMVDLRREWRAFDQEQYTSRARTGPPTTWRYYNKGLGTELRPIIPNLKIRSSKSISANATKTTSKENGLRSAIIETSRICSMLKLPTITKEEAARFCHNMQKKHLFSWGIEPTAAVIVYIVCKQQKIPRTFQEIAEASRIELKIIKRAYLSLQKKLKLKPQCFSGVELVPRFCSELGLNSRIQELAIEIIREAEKQGLTDGKQQQGTAAAAIYIAAFLNHRRCRQKDIARVAGVCELTIRTRYKEMSEKLQIEI